MYRIRLQKAENAVPISLKRKMRYAESKIVPVGLDEIMACYRGWINMMFAEWTNKSFACKYGEKEFILTIFFFYQDEFLKSLKWTVLSVSNVEFPFL